MDLSIELDDLGRLICTVDDQGRPAVVIASEPRAAAGDLLAALDEASDTGFGECLWPTDAGDYRWMLRRSGDRLIVVALWSRGTLTGWDHVLRADTDFAAFAASVRAGLAAVDGMP
jgi:hypothetical protein